MKITLKEEKHVITTTSYILYSRYTSVGRTKIVYEIREG